MDPPFIETSIEMKLLYIVCPDAIIHIIHHSFRKKDPVLIYLSQAPRHDKTQNASVHFSECVPQNMKFEIFPKLCHFFSCRKIHSAFITFNDLMQIDFIVHKCVYVIYRNHLYVVAYSNNVF